MWKRFYVVNNQKRLQTCNWLMCILISTIVTYTLPLLLQAVCDFTGSGGGVSHSVPPGGDVKGPW